VQQTFSEPGGEWSVWHQAFVWRDDKSVQRYEGTKVLRREGMVDGGDAAGLSLGSWSGGKWGCYAETELIIRLSTK
jgi:hypothetical protein